MVHAKRWLSGRSGVPAGVFTPSLAIGASIGSDVALLASGIARLITKPMYEELGEVIRRNPPSQPA
ncbi:MAG: hypothetical protein RIS35_877 [Pseudomonadota bacterium]|jgi:H+/Cl- antiporter ClcA